MFCKHVHMHCRYIRHFHRHCRSVGVEYDINHWFSEKLDAYINRIKKPQHNSIWTWHKVIYAHDKDTIIFRLRIYCPNLIEHTSQHPHHHCVYASFILWSFFTCSINDGLTICLHVELISWFFFCCDRIADRFLRLIDIICKFHNMPIDFDSGFFFLFCEMMSANVDYPFY